jgi:hypothetical protein
MNITNGCRSMASLALTLYTLRRSENFEYLHICTPFRQFQLSTVIAEKQYSWNLMFTPVVLPITINCVLTDHRQLRRRLTSFNEVQYAKVLTRQMVIRFNFIRQVSLQYGQTHRGTHLLRQMEPFHVILRSSDTTDLEGSWRCIDLWLCTTVNVGTFYHNRLDI